MTKETEKQIPPLVEAFAEDLTATLRRAIDTAVEEALSRSSGRGSRNRAKGPTSPSAAAVTPRRRGGSSTGASAGQLDERLYREIKKAGGRRLEELAEALRIESTVLKAPARKLVVEKRIKKKGQARGTRYTAR